MRSQRRVLWLEGERWRGVAFTYRNDSCVLIEVGLRSAGLEKEIFIYPRFCCVVAG